MPRLQADIEHQMQMAFVSIFVLASGGPAQPEASTGPNGFKQELMTHTPPAPPPYEQTQATDGIAEFSRGKLKVFQSPHIDVLTYHYDNERFGWNPHEIDLTPKGVVSPRFSLLKTLRMDGNVFAQPLLISNFVMLVSVF
jgi:hypothetical protein